ncbi:hypothetical protein TMEN_8088 [Trichophyton mentagrophytes]|nr:hypothetical protein TMEN_8088 [Trichophyton mentagrophytes]
MSRVHYITQRDPMQQKYPDSCAVEYHQEDLSQEATGHSGAITKPYEVLI